MHLESKTPLKEMVQLNESLILERRPSCLEEDLALSSSTHGSINEKTTEAEDKSLDEEAASDSPRSSPTGISEIDVQPAEEESAVTRSSPRVPLTDPSAVVYVSEDAMDCNYDEPSSRTITTSVVDNVPAPSDPPTANLQLWTSSRHFELPEDQPSPEMFESDADDEAETSTNTTATSLTTATTATSVTATCPSAATGQTLEEFGPSQISPIVMPSTEEMILRADKFLLRQVNKYLSGVPPPPCHTISQKDCDDFLVYLKQNRSYFWADPFLLDGKPESQMPASQMEPTQIDEIKDEETCASTSSRASQQSKTGMRNLSTAFDACERSSLGTRPSQNDLSVLDPDLIDSTSCSLSLSDTLFNSSLLSTSAFAATQIDEDAEIRHLAMPTLYSSIKPEEVAELSWSTAYLHRCPEIYYNRNKALEDFENLRMKLCDRYIGNETQSTCNVWFAKQMPTSARKRSLLAKRNNGQSPGKRLSYLAKRRKTFSCANLQVLNFPEKKLMLNVKKGHLRKGKSPRGKSPRGKSPRGKTPRGSAKKRYIRRLQLEGPSPRKVKLETSKRALFQSPPNDRPGPSREVAKATATVTSATNNPKKFKRALFPTPKKNDVTSDNLSESLSYPESRKRKSDEVLENPKQKWSKSLSFDCSHNLDNSSPNTNGMRHSTSSVMSKYGSNSGKSELSDAHRKKLLWAVAEALRSKGIGMNHPQFKSYGSALARTVRKFMPDLENKNIPRKPGSTSDRMIKIAKRHVLLLVDGKTDI